jgi:hypothetical protein
MSLTEKIQSDLVDAMRRKQPARLGTLRMIKAALKNREVEKRDVLSEAESHAVLHTMVKQRRDSVEQFRKGGREAMAVREEEEIQIIEEYLPPHATEAEIRDAIAAALAETGATGLGDMGKVMKATLARLAGKTADGGHVSTLVRDALQAR